MCPREKEERAVLLGKKEAKVSLRLKRPHVRGGVSDGGESTSPDGGRSSEEWNDPEERPYQMSPSLTHDPLLSQT